MRYVNREKEIRKVFLDFLNLDRITGKHIGKSLMKFYSESGIDLGSCRCTPNMQSVKKDVANYILKGSPKAIVTHCSSHNLNLSIAATSKIPITDNILEVYRNISIYFNTSLKRDRLLEHDAENRCKSPERRKILIEMCKTRWSERDALYEHFYLAIPFMAEALDIILGIHSNIEQFNIEFSMDWDAQEKREANSLLNAITKFEFIIGIITLYRLLHPLLYIIERLQGRTTDIVYGYSNIQETIDDLNHLRKNVEKETCAVYKQATRMASKLFIEPTIPRIPMRQAYRNNVPAESPHECYKRALIIPYLDTIISEIKIRFQKTNCIAAKVLCLVPSKICSEEITAFQELVEMYKSDL
ncbi:52 kDa repressor of the inhibitor of the protein kinase-like [Hydra vulgaris]|uniref:52 kDa repressor of the inhibitor of the protein kinase-like n=1 Tax=Hydra vulgaris TaxID=6087 RepID=A0ABM4BPV8_HYDVU